MNPPEIGGDDVWFFFLLHEFEFEFEPNSTVRAQGLSVRIAPSKAQGERAPNRSVRVRIAPDPWYVSVSEHPNTRGWESEAVTFFGFLWGPTGMLLSVPMMTCLGMGQPGVGEEVWRNRGKQGEKDWT